MRRKMIQTKGKGDNKSDKGMTVEARQTEMDFFREETRTQWCQFLKSRYAW